MKKVQNSISTFPHILPAPHIKPTNHTVARPFFLCFNSDMKDMDAFLKDLTRALEKSGADSMTEEDQKKLLDTLMAEGLPQTSFNDLTPEEQAKEYVYMALAESREKKFRSSIGVALSIDPFCEFAYEALGDREEDSFFSIAYYKFAMDLGLDTYLRGPHEKQVPVGMFYGHFETRSTIRSMYKYADCLLAIDAIEKAIQIYKEIVRLNENDNMGARFMLFHLLVQQGQKQEFKTYRKQFPEDSSCDVNYAIALYTFKFFSDDTAEMERVKEQALRSNTHVPQIFRENVEFDFDGDTYRVGGEDEAHIYLDTYGEFWDEVNGAREWLESW